MFKEVIENNFINNLAEKFCRSPYQQNDLHESDSEIILLPGNSGVSIAITIDSISEEILTGLYDDPHLIGWMTVIVNLSDIAASGAEPIGILISEVFTGDMPQEYVNKIQEGINDAVNKCGVFVLGGDTNYGNQLILTGCAIGKSSDNKFLTRRGCKEGDLIYATYKAGKGNAFALVKLTDKNSAFVNYYPEARLKEASIIKKFASCCIDTSDGFLSALDQLMRINNTGFNVTENLKNILDEDSALTAEIYNIPEWLLLAGQHGEFELLFTIPPNRESELLSAARKINWDPLKIGVVTAKPEILLNLHNRSNPVQVDTAKIRNLLYETKGDIKKYLKELIDYDAVLRFNYV